MSPYIAFILGGFAGALVYKVIYDSAAKRKRNALIKSVIDTTTELIKSLGNNENDSEDTVKSVEDNIVELANIFNEATDASGDENQPKN